MTRNRQTAGLFHQRQRSCNARQCQDTIPSAGVVDRHAEQLRPGRPRPEHQPRVAVAVELDRGCAGVAGGGGRVDRNLVVDRGSALARVIVPLTLKSITEVLPDGSPSTALIASRNDPVPSSSRLETVNADNFWPSRTCHTTRPDHPPRCIGKGAGDPCVAGRDDWLVRARRLTQARHVTASDFLSVLTRSAQPDRSKLAIETSSSMSGQ
jgi:hypothetical protein